MKIAIPTSGNVVDDHFGHCDMYTIFTIHNSKIEVVEHLPSAKECGCKSNIAAILQQKGVGVMLAGNMGNGALSMLNSYGIEVYRGCSGSVDQLIRAFLQNKVNDSGKICNGHSSDHDHSCHHI